MYQGCPETNTPYFFKQIFFSRSRKSHIVKSAGGNARVLRVTWRSQVLKSGETKTSSSLSESPHSKQASKKASKHPRRSLSSCWCSLFLRISVLQWVQVRESTLKPLWSSTLAQPQVPQFLSTSLCFWISTWAWAPDSRSSATRRSLQHHTGGFAI
jgi:ribosomal protein L34E